MPWLRAALRMTLTSSILTNFRASSVPARSLGNLGIGEDFVPDYVEMQHFGLGIGEMAVHGVPDVGLDFFEGLALRENRLTKGTCHVSPFRGILDQEKKLFHAVSIPSRPGSCQFNPEDLPRTFAHTPIPPRIPAARRRA